ncbi:MAG TPA: glutathione S-transferase family protein [Solirubrobacteraceae bacterium]|jgi:glutathione S-transferase
MRTLYDNAFSPFARKVRLVLDHKSLAVDAVDALRPEARDVLAAVNPRLEVPVLVDDGLVVVNSADIVAYLEQRYPARPVYPADPAVRVRARAVERMADTLLDAILHDLSVFGWAFPGTAPPPGLVDAGRADLEALYDDLERALAGGPYVCGELSIADLALFPHLSGVRFLGIPFTEERHPRLLGWYRHMRTLDICRGDLARVQAWLARRTGQGTRLPHVVWRGDRIEWLLAQGFHEWFVDEMRAGRVAWPRA